MDVVNMPFGVPRKESEPASLFVDRTEHEPIADLETGDKHTGTRAPRNPHTVATCVCCARDRLSSLTLLTYPLGKLLVRQEFWRGHVGCPRCGGNFTGTAGPCVPRRWHIGDDEDEHR